MEQHENQQQTGIPALEVAGAIELTISVVLFFLQFYLIAIFFAFASMAVGFVANQVRRRGTWYAPQDDPIHISEQQARKGLIATGVISGGLVIGAAVLLLLDLQPQSAVLVFWAMATAVLLDRFRG